MTAVSADKCDAHQQSRTINWKSCGFLACLVLSLLFLPRLPVVGLPECTEVPAGNSLAPVISQTGLAFPGLSTDDFEALPKDIRTSVDIVRRFGPAAIVKRRGQATCPGTP